MSFIMKDSKNGLIQQLRALLDDDNAAQIIKLLKPLRHEDISDLFRSIDEEEKYKLFSCLQKGFPRTTAAQVLEDLDPRSESIVVKKLLDKELIELIHSMEDDNAADLIEELPEQRSKRILNLLRSRQDDTLHELLQYEGDTAGGVMTQDYIAVRDTATVQQALLKIRRRAKTNRDIYNIFIIDHYHHLVGILPLRNLLRAKGRESVSNIFHHDVIKVHVDADQEEVAHIVRKYDILSVPVVDNDNKLVGVITVDDIIDIIHEEFTEDILTMAGTNEDELITTSVFNISRLRLPWLLTCFIGSALNIFIMHWIGEDILANILALSYFIPALIAMGGNIGIQSSTITIRGLTTGRIDSHNWFKAVFRETRVGFTLGLIIGVIIGGLGAVISYYLFKQSPYIGLVVGISMVIGSSFSAFTGAIMPFILSRYNVDPAKAAGPFVTTANDISGIIIYFLTASLLLTFLMK